MILIKVWASGFGGGKITAFQRANCLAKDCDERTSGFSSAVSGRKDKQTRARFCFIWTREGSSQCDICSHSEGTECTHIL